MSQIASATASDSASIDAYEIDLNRPNRKTRQLVVNARTLDDGDLDHIRLLLAITDVTEMRASAPGASMIADPERLPIQVNVDDSAVDADVSVSLGLIVTELVIMPSNTLSQMSGPGRS